MNNEDYKDAVLDYSALSQKEIQLLMLQELRGVNEKLRALDRELQEVSKKVLVITEHDKRLTFLEKQNEEAELQIKKLEKFRTQATTAMVVINILWTVAIALYNALKP